MRPEQSWDLQYRGAEAYNARRTFELANFGTTSVLSPRSARLARGVPPSSPTRPSGSRPPRTQALPGVYTISARRQRNSAHSDISLPQLPSRVAPGFTRRELDTTIEFSSDGSRAVRVAESRNVPIVKRVRLDQDNWSGHGIDTPAAEEDSDSEESCESEVSDREDNWQDVVEGSNPAAVIDETGEIRESKRRTYASADDPMSLFIPMANIILDEIFVRESLPAGLCCQTCRASLATPQTSAHSTPPPFIPDPQSSTSEPTEVLPSSSSGNIHSPPLASAVPSSCGAGTGASPSLTEPGLSDVNVPGGHPSLQSQGVSSVEELFKCTTCGEFVECRTCCLKRHRYTPLHTLKVWNTGGYFSRTSLRNLGLCFQLGHGGDSCPVSGALRQITVMHVNGVHSVTTAVCGCDLSDEANEWRQYIRTGWYPASTSQPRTFATFECLRHFRRLNVVANVNVRDYVTTLERLTDPVGLDFVPDRYKSFGMMSQQVSYMDRLRRSGVAFLKDGIRSASWGSTAVRCWACPRAKVNLPENWKEVDENLQFKYALILGMDACFRLENRLRQKSKNKAYSFLSDGLGCFVPHDSYFSHLQDNVKEEDISSCIAFAVLMQKDTRLSKGLRATGVGGCICTRHEIIRPLGLGDLLKGERYANMDYIFWASILGEDLLRLIVSYDIGCQWKIHLMERQSRLPAILREEIEGRKICVGLPVWHGVVHKDSWATSESLRYKEGAGMTDGEGVERVWSKLGPKAWATKEMHENTRQESLDDTMDDLNWTKNLGLGKYCVILRRRYEVAKVEKREQAENFKATSSTLDIGLRERWMKSIKDWHEQEYVLAKDKTVDNPYEASWKRDTITIDQVHTQLDQQEQEELRREQDENAEESTGGSVRREAKGLAGVLAFVRLGLHIQSMQLRIKNMNRARRKEDGHARLLQARRTGFWKKLRRFRALQATYMPQALVLASEHEQGISAKRDATARKAGVPVKPVEAEDVKLFLPSEIPVAECGPSYRTAIFSTESRLREAQCSTQLSTLRMRLHSKSHLIRFRDANLRGQAKTTRSRGALERLSDRIDSAVCRYRVARKALIALDGGNKWDHFRVLEDTDVSTRFVTDYDGQRARRLAKIGRDGKRRMMAAAEVEDEVGNGGAEARGGSRRKLSWIWTAQGVPDPDTDEGLHESIRTEWTKAYARKERWREEVILLEEEMRRVLASLEHEQGEWLRRKNDVSGTDRIAMGKRAYAHRQAALRVKLREEFKGRFEGTDELGRTGKKRRVNVAPQT